MVFKSKAPLRIGLAGGGTDVSPYSDLFGGAILNATISLYARASIAFLEEPIVLIEATDRSESITLPLTDQLPINGELDLVKGVFNRLKRENKLPTRGIRIQTEVDAPAGSGLGTSSTLMVAILGAFAKACKLSYGEYDLAHLAYEIERKDLGLAGGKQDQYAATFGGVNFMEFSSDDKVIVNPLRVKPEYLDELENNLLLYYSDTSRESARIIAIQQKNVHEKNIRSIEAMHQLKDQAHQMKEALMQGRLDLIGEILDYGFQQKKRMAEGISNDWLEEIYQTARKAGASGGKISGAGGGGFMIFYCPAKTRNAVAESLTRLGGRVQSYQFTCSGIRSWTA
ncbi:MAG: dehydrogenase [Bacteroidetes bacterium]|nr:dehydrogenase [Bacteroidota bacterium]